MITDFHKAPKAWAQVKHSLLGNYLSLFLGKVGQKGAPVFYVDGFAGPGRLADGTEGSPLIAAALAANPPQRSRQGILRCINVEREHDTYVNLEQATARHVRAGIVRNFEGAFQDRLREILREVGDSTAFFFIDPFGTEGVEVDTLQRIAARPGKTELLVRYDDTRVKRLLSWAVNNAESLDEGHQQTARAFKKRVDQLTDEQAASLVNSECSGAVKSEALLEGYVRKVKSLTGLRFSLSYPIRNPETKGHRYFLVHFCGFPDGYIHMANFMAKVERSVEGPTNKDLFIRPQMEFMAVNEHLAKLKRTEMVDKTRERLRALGTELSDNRVQNRDLFARLVDEFKWTALRSEYVEALRRLADAGLVEMEGTDDNNFTVFSR